MRGGSGEERWAGKESLRGDYGEYNNCGPRYVCARVSRRVFWPREGELKIIRSSLSRILSRPKIT